MYQVISSTKSWKKLKLENERSSSQFTKGRVCLHKTYFAAVSKPTLATSVIWELREIHNIDVVPQSIFIGQIRVSEFNQRFCQLLNLPGCKSKA